MKGALIIIAAGCLAGALEPATKPDTESDTTRVQARGPIEEAILRAQDGGRGGGGDVRAPSALNGAIGEICVIDQYQPSAECLMAYFDQTGLAQSFKQAHDNIGGAAIFLHPDVVASTPVVISLWDALPNNGGHLLASATGWGVPESFFDVFWEPVFITPGVTYYLTFDSDTGMGIRGDTANPYPYGNRRDHQCGKVERCP